MDYEFYDTNIVIFLLDKMAEDEEKLRNFLSGHKILVTNRVMGEIRASNSRNLEFERLVSICKVYFVDPDKIAEEECRHHNSPGGFPLRFQPKRLDPWLTNFMEHGVRDILPSDTEIKENVFQNYEMKIQSHIGSMHDERELRASINVKVVELGQELGIDISPAEVTYEKPRIGVAF